MWTELKSLANKMKKDVQYQAVDFTRELQKFEIEFKKGFSKPLILFVLAEKPDYPFGISKTLRNITNNKIKIEGSNIYPILDSLWKSGLIIGVEEGNSRKRIYSLTDEGKNFLNSLRLSMKEFVGTIQKIINI